MVLTAGGMLSSGAYAITIPTVPFEIADGKFASTPNLSTAWASQFSPGALSEAVAIAPASNAGGSFYTTTAVAFNSVTPYGSSSANYLGTDYSVFLVLNGFGSYTNIFSPQGVTTAYEYDKLSYGLYAVQNANVLCGSGSCLSTSNSAGFFQEMSNDIKALTAADITAYAQTAAALGTAPYQFTGSVTPSAYTLLATGGLSSANGSGATLAHLCITASVCIDTSSFSIVAPFTQTSDGLSYFLSPAHLNIGYGSGNLTGATDLINPTSGVKTVTAEANLGFNSVPEPDSLALLGLGTVLMGRSLKRRQVA
jgi:hypothetical protein